jgi:hypothetical protein
MLSIAVVLARPQSEMTLCWRRESELAFSEFAFLHVSPSQ